MLIDVICRHSLRDKIHAKLHGYNLPETPVRVLRGCYLINDYSGIDCLLARVFSQTKRCATLIIEGKCVSFSDVENAYNFLADEDKEFFVVLRSSALGPDLLKIYQESGLVIGDISKAHKHKYNFLGISGESTILYDYRVFRLDAK